MRIAYVYDAVYPYITGGVERRVWEISQRLAKRGHDVHIYGMRVWGEEKILKKGGVTLHGTCSPRSLYRRGRRTYSQAIIFGLSVFLPLVKEDFDVIDCQQFPFFSALSAVLSNRITGSPLIITWHEVWNGYWYDYIGFPGCAGKFLERVVAHNSSHAVAVSELTKEGLQKLVRDKEIKIIPNGIDLEAIDAIIPSDQSSDLIFAGRLIKEKHIDILLESIVILKETHPDITCMIIGDGPERHNLKLMTEMWGLNDNVVFTGFLPSPEDINAHMKSSKVFVLPSTREGFGIAALEALACGLPVVTIDHPQNASAVFAGHGCGALSRLDSKDMAIKIHEVLADTSRRSAICRQKAQGYDWNVITDYLEEHYHRISAQKRSVQRFP
ncbi:MAG TPA: glycosyltransferase family 4 protein [Methanoregulaceae archaeon]|nr:MAG: glycosyltransferase family 4 protein [Methanolinea sp.]HON82270.1 glycosyltransferase family 4 protein [Methanoregulaceae archaeon]HPD09850.1 glycosyltransferase family 4 protein [Methanoregulaceae archaeon]HRT14959.1 glycosyltransferase family 4 protein [Methanoregulaceae archaeon]HRU30426.1 glycosyltransferase family 4 protein [Methanoregulaceae archaeon]